MSASDQPRYVPDAYTRQLVRCKYDDLIDTWVRKHVVEQVSIRFEIIDIQHARFYYD